MISDVYKQIEKISNTNPIWVELNMYHDTRRHDLADMISSGSLSKFEETILIKHNISMPSSQDRFQYEHKKIVVEHSDPTSVFYDDESRLEWASIKLRKKYY